MNKVQVLFAATFFLFISSCENINSGKNENNGFSKELLMGEWEQVSPVPKEMETVSCKVYRLRIVISDSVIGNYTNCDAFLQTQFDKYTFDGFDITYGDTTNQTILSIVSLSGKDLIVDRQTPDTTQNYRITYSSLE